IDRLGPPDRADRLPLGMSVPTSCITSEARFDRVLPDGAKPIRFGRQSWIPLVLVLAATTFVACLGAPSATANDLSTYPCTAGDVEIIGFGTVINEACACTPGGSFKATALFTARTHTSTARYCTAC